SAGFASVLVYVEDNSDSGAGNDVFRIFFCTLSPFLPGPSFNGSGAPPSCVGPQGNTLRSGNIQVRRSDGADPSTAVTAAGDSLLGSYGLGVLVNADSSAHG